MHAYPHPAQHVLREFVTRMVVPSREERSGKCWGGEGGSNSQQGQKGECICDGLEAPVEIQKDGFQIWNGTPWSHKSLIFGIV